MAGLTDSLSSTLSSFFATIRSILETLFHSVESVFALITGSVQSVVDLAGGLVNFVLGHVVIIGVLIAAYVGYTAYAQKRQPGGITKKRN